MQTKITYDKGMKYQLQSQINSHSHSSPYMLFVSVSVEDLCHLGSWGRIHMYCKP